MAEHSVRSDAGFDAHFFTGEGLTKQELLAALDLAREYVETRTSDQLPTMVVRPPHGPGSKVAVSGEVVEFFVRIDVYERRTQ